MVKIHTNKPGYYGAGSIELSSSLEGEGSIRRCALSPDKLITQPLEGIDTVPDILFYSARTHGNRKALGWRDVIRIVEEEKNVTKVIDGKQVVEKKLWKYFELSDYQFISYIELKEAISEVSRALIHLGINKDDVFNVYAQTSLNWQLIALGCGCISTTIATAYDTLGEEGLKHSLSEPNSVGIFTNADLLPTLLKVLPETPSVKYVIYDGDAKQTIIDGIRSHHGTQVFHISELREIGKTKSIDILESRLPKKEDLALIMYTSGSTGAPKGVCITHANLVASVGAANLFLGHHFTHEDAYLAFLPLAHVLEYIVELIMIFVGMPCGYGRVKTLTDASVRNCKGDINTLRPSIMVGVPAIWETIRKGIVAKVNSGGTLQKNIFNIAMILKKWNVPILGQLADNFVLSGVRAATGGRLRIALCGGAAINRDTQEFLTTALVTVIQGYGMTESCGMCAILPPELMRYEAVGLPLPSIEIKLLDVTEAGYLASSTPPQGEVCIRGPSVLSGYYKRPDLNNDENIFTKDGWLRTGDIGQWNSDGTLSLIDRIKNLIKLASGEYIALEHLEATYKSCNLVGNICVHATPQAQQPMAIVIPNDHHLRHVLQAKGIKSDTTLAELCHDPAVQDVVLKECNAIAKKNGFKAQELLQAVVLTPDEWTPENGLVTAAQKIQRAKIAKTFRDEINAVYTTS